MPRHQKIVAKIMAELEWIEQTTNVERIYMFRNWEGNHYEAAVERDGADVAEMYRDVTTVSGTILGSHPDLGDVYWSSDLPATTKAFETGGSGPWVRITPAS